MKRSQTIRYGLRVVIAGWGAILTAQATTTQDFSRYQVILDRSPFGEVAPIVLPGAAGLAIAESFAKDYEMKAIIDNGDNIQVGILDKKTKKHIYLDIGQEIGGMQLVSANYEKEEAVLKMGAETTVIMLHPDKDKSAEAAPALVGAPGMSPFGMPAKNLATDNAASPFNNQGGRTSFFSDMKKRGALPFRRMGTNASFQSKGLGSFFKPNTNMATPFVSPFRPQGSPLQPGSAGQDNPGSILPFASPTTPAQSGGTVAADQPFNPDPQIQTSPNYPQVPIQSSMTVPVMDDEAVESEE